MSAPRLLPSYAGYVARCIFPGKKAEESGRKYFRVRYGVLRVYPDESSYAAAFKVNLRRGQIEFNYHTTTIIWRLANHQQAEVNRKYELSFTTESRDEFDIWLNVINQCTFWALEENYPPIYTVKQTYKMKEQVGKCIRDVYGKETTDTAMEIIIRKFYTDDILEKNRILRDHEVSFGNQHKHILESLDYLVDVDSVITIHERYYDDLRSVLGQFEGGKLMELYAYFIIKAIVSSLVHLHTNRYTYHGDIRPENVKFAANNVVKLSGFYHADITAKNGRTTFMALNPLFQHYWPPEYGHEKWWSNKIDSWQVGALLFECLSGKKTAQFHKFPNEADRPCPDFRIYFEKLGWAKLSGDCRSFLEEAMKYNPAKRATMTQLENHPWLHRRPERGKSKVVPRADEGLPDEIEPVEGDLALAPQQIDTDNHSNFGNKV